MPTTPKRADRARRYGRIGPGSVPATTARRTVVHPVVLPVLLGLAVNLLGVSLPGPVDDVPALLGQAVVPLYLVLIGLSLAHHGVRGVARAALAFVATGPVWLLVVGLLPP